MEKENTEAEQKPFKLAGSIKTPEGEDDLDVEEMISQIRREQAELTRKKFEDLYDDDDD